MLFTFSSHLYILNVRPVIVLFLYSLLLMWLVHIYVSWPRVWYWNVYYANRTNSFVRVAILIVHFEKRLRLKFLLMDSSTCRRLRSHTKGRSRDRSRNWIRSRGRASNISGVFGWQSKSAWQSGSQSETGKACDFALEFDASLQNFVRQLGCTRQCHSLW